MAAIDVYLQAILDAVYGEEVRGSIHDAIQAMNVESSDAKAAAEGYRDSAKSYSESAAQSAADALAASSNPPYIGANGNWYVYSTSAHQYVDSHVDASITVAISAVNMLNPDQPPSVQNLGTNTDANWVFNIPRGKGITTIEKTSTVGLVDTYTVTYSDGATYTYTVTNGEKGDKGDHGLDGGGSMRYENKSIIFTPVPQSP